jgi:Sap, sulfolipid-1-addressing protein
MPVQAIPLALISSLYPLGLAAILLLAETPRPRPRVGVFLIGALACTLTVGFVVVFVLHDAGVGQGSQQSDQYWLRLAIGVVFMAVAVFLARRRPRPQSGPSRVSRAASQGGLFAIFVVGVALYLPSPSYLSALQVVGTTEMSDAATAVWVIIVVAIVLITVEVPVLLFLLAPGWTVPKLQAVNAWLDRNGHTLLVAVVGAIGLWEFLDGLVGLLSRPPGYR